MRTCNACGAEHLPSDAAFCSRCGSADLADPPPTAAPVVVRPALKLAAAVVIAVGIALVVVNTGGGNGGSDDGSDARSFATPATADPGCSALRDELDDLPNRGRTSEKRRLNDELEELGCAPYDGNYVIYDVRGSATHAGITLATPTGTSQATPDVPITMDEGDREGLNGLLVGPFRPGDFLYISAQNETDSGMVMCRITTSDGVLLSENSSSADYGIATCEASMP